MKKGIDIFSVEAPKLMQKYGHLKQYCKPQNGMDLAED